MTSKEFFEKLQINYQSVDLIRSLDLVSKERLQVMFPFLVSKEKVRSEEESGTVYVLDGTVLNEELLTHLFLSNEPARIEYWETLTAEGVENLVRTSIIDHLEGNSEVAPLIDLITAHYPEYSYTGIAYRVILLYGTETFDINKVLPNTSWALNPEGREAFMKNNTFFDMQHGTKSEERKVMIEADISGVSLVRLIHEKFPDLIEDSLTARFIKEDEVLAREILSIHKVL